MTFWYLLTDSATDCVSEVFTAVVDKGGIDVSYFEVLFLTSLVHFHREGCDWAVVEAGLGGLKDATNIVTPNITAITSVDLDHTVRRAGKAAKAIVLHCYTLLCCMFYE